jgi:hypothetical protein
MGMTPAERDRMNVLSMLIQCERDHQTYIECVKELTELRSQKEKRLAAAELNARTEPQHLRLGYMVRGWDNSL